jgi:hypothetical protein
MLDPKIHSTEIAKAIDWGFDENDLMIVDE